MILIQIPQITSGRHLCTAVQHYILILLKVRDRKLPEILVSDWDVRKMS